MTKLTAQDVLDSMTFTASAEDTEYYSFIDYFTADLPDEMTRSEWLKWLVAHYRGVDCDGIGVLWTI